MVKITFYILILIQNTIIKVSKKHIEGKHHVNYQAIKDIQF